MQRFIAKANVDHFIGLLNGNDLTPDKRTAITKLLIAELDKLAHDLDHLEFAEKKAAEGRERVIRVRDSRNGHPFGTSEREQAERLLVSCENLQTVLEDFCHRLREKVNSLGGTIYSGPRRNLIYSHYHRGFACRHRWLRDRLRSRLRKGSAPCGNPRQHHLIVIYNWR